MQLRIRRLGAITLAIAGVLLTASVTSAQPRHRDEREARGSEGRMEQFIAEHADELGLDEQTQGEIKAIVEDARRESEKLRSAQRQAARSLSELLELDEPDRQSVMSQADVVGELESARRKLRLGAMLEIRALLTPEQRAKLVEIEGPRRSERRERMMACRGDVERLCEGGRRPRVIMQCLREHRSELSSECGRAFDATREDLSRRWDRSPWNEQEP